MKHFFKNLYFFKNNFTHILVVIVLINAFFISGYNHEIFGKMSNENTREEEAQKYVITLPTQTIFQTEDRMIFGWQGALDRTGAGLKSGIPLHEELYDQTTSSLYNRPARHFRQKIFHTEINKILVFLTFHVNLVYIRSFAD